MFYCEPMPLEATADNVQLTAFVAKATNSTAQARPFLRVLLRLADYLVDNGLHPALQLTSDDYMGAHANNTNLAVKAIVAIGGFAQLCEMLAAEGFAGAAAAPAQAPGTDWRQKARHYRAISEAYARTWARETAGGYLGGHLSAYGSNATFSLKYNLVWDKVLGTHLFADVIEAECAVFRRLQRTYGLEYGLPFSGDASSLNASNATGSFYQVLSPGETAIQQKMTAMSARLVRKSLRNDNQ